MAGSELNVSSGQCLDWRIAGKQPLVKEVVAREAIRNQDHAKADWQFTTAGARAKPKRSYPSS